MRSLFLLPFLAVALSAAPVLTGPVSAIAGQQSVFAVSKVSSPFAWVAVPPGSTEADARRVNNDRPALVTTWQNRPGKWRVWVEDKSGRSNEVVITVMSDDASALAPQLVADPNAVVAWSETMQVAPRGALSKDLNGEANAGPVKRLIPDMPDTPVSSMAIGMNTPQQNSPTLGETISGYIESDEDGSPVILAPNADNVVDLAAQLIEPEVPGSLRNPFVRARNMNSKPKDFKIILSAVVMGPRSAVVLNDMVHSMNDIIAGTPLRVAEITRDYATLRTGRFMLRIPVDVETTIRLPN